MVAYCRLKILVFFILVFILCHDYNSSLSKIHEFNKKCKQLTGVNCTFELYYPKTNSDSGSTLTVFLA